MKTKTILVVIFLTSIIFLFISYFLYHYVSVGINYCGGCGSGWLSPIENLTPKMFQSNTNCLDMCVETPIPHPLNVHFLIGGVLLLAGAVFLLLIQVLRAVPNLLRSNDT